MKRFVCSLTLIAVAILFAGCKKQESDADAVRTGINQHLASLKTINLGAMDMNVTNISVNGNQAQAQVEFKPKTGAPQGAGMQVAYNLEKRDGAWVVLKTQAAGGMIEHPAPGQNPHQNQDAHATQLPNFSEIVTPAGATASGVLPPGHPAIPSQPTKSDQPEGQKPR